MYCATSEFFQYPKIGYCLPFKEAWEWKKSLGLPRWHKAPSWVRGANGGHQPLTRAEKPQGLFPLTDASVSISSQWMHCSPWMGYPLEAAFSLPADIHGTTSLCSPRGCWVCKKQKIVLAELWQCLDAPHESTISLLHCNSRAHPGKHWQWLLNYSQHYRIVVIGRHQAGITQSSLLAWSRFTQSTLPRTVSHQVFSIAKTGDPTTSPGSLFQGFTVLTVKKKIFYTHGRAQEALAHEGTLLAHVHLGIHQDPQLLPCYIALQMLRLRCSHTRGWLFLPSGRTLRFSFTRCPPAHFSSLPLWTAAQPPGLPTKFSTSSGKFAFRHPSGCCPYTLRRQ